MATDNAVSALGKICEHQRDSIDGAQVRKFLSPTCDFLHATSSRVWFFEHEPELKHVPDYTLLNISGCASMVRVLAIEGGSCGSKNCPRAVVHHGREVSWCPPNLMNLPVSLLRSCDYEIANEFHLAGRILYYLDRTTNTSRRSSPFLLRYE